MNLPLLTSRSRLMMFAPHPDDESLATGIFLQRALAAGAAVRVVYATDGERNCWPQRFLERKVRLRESDRKRWGARRQAEALAALRSLGITPEEVNFLSLPDQGVTDLLLRGCRQTLRRLASVVREWEPTHLLLPSATDTHPDHSGLAVLLEIALETYLASGDDLVRLHYLVHGASDSFSRAACELPHSLLEKRAKRRAIVCHVTQVALSRRRFLSYARRPERFVVGPERSAAICDGPIRSFQRDPYGLHLHVAFALKPLRAEETSLYLVGHDSLGDLRRLRVTLPGRDARLDLIDVANGGIAGVGRYAGDAFQAEIFLPTNGFVPGRSVFLKLDRRVWFFDEAGWLAIGPAVSPLAAQLPLRLRHPVLAVA
ncbi:MAG TPA: PIG-L family deacetylase [Chthoniobacterales bacterium]|jgi:LmbE family N-acetylglucosaminyl deacetylase